MLRLLKLSRDSIRTFSSILAHFALQSRSLQVCFKLRTKQHKPTCLAHRPTRLQNSLLLSATTSKLTSQTSLYSQTIPPENNLSFTKLGHELKAAREPGSCAQPNKNRSGFSSPLFPPAGFQMSSRRRAQFQLRLSEDVWQSTGKPQRPQMHRGRWGVWPRTCSPLYVLAPQTPPEAPRGQGCSQTPQPPPFSFPCRGARQRQSILEVPKFRATPRGSSQKCLA